ncbi:MAG TPA: hypothetical protein VLQ93_04455 [Myxococcaceae bacterium]|nr:hypothetical protein [Myxococcaceae bacterium]
MSLPRWIVGAPTLPRPERRCLHAQDRSYQRTPVEGVILERVAL